MILGSICARGGSKGVPDKNLASVGDQTLMQRAVESARAARSIDALICSTDDARICELARAHGVETPVMRPPELSRDGSSKWPVFRHVIEVAEAHFGRNVEILVDLDLGTPFRTAADIERCVEAVRGPDVDVVTTGYLADRNPYFNMAEVDEQGYSQIVKQTPEAITSRHDAPRVYSLTPVVWAMTREFIFDAEHWRDGRLIVVEIPRARGVDIDHPVDLAFAEFLCCERPDLLDDA